MGFTQPCWSLPLNASPAPKAQFSAVSGPEPEAEPLSFDTDGFEADGFEADSPSDAPLPIGATPLEDALLNKLDEDKAQDIVLIDLRGKSPMSDAMIVASGRSHRHVGAVADHLLRLLKDLGLGKVKVEGLPHCDWVLIDAGDVIVHLFRPEVRSFYNIEKIWSVDSGHRGGAAGVA